MLTELSHEVAITIVVLVCSDPFTEREEISFGGLGKAMSCSWELFFARLAMVCE